MPEPEGRSRAVYDHTEEEEPRRRRRQIADWGVGEELFDGMPGRRFERRGEDHRIPRGGVDDGRRTIVIADGETRPAAGPVEDVDAEFASREEALRARQEHDAVWAGDEPFADEAHEEDEQPLAEERDLAEEPFVSEAPRASGPVAYDRADGIARTDSIVRGGVEGRRTVKIGGRPTEFHSAPVRRRTVHERVGPRPDRIAAWAFALGLLLILIAIATASI
jgi:hypothetical protein